MKLDLQLQLNGSYPLFQMYGHNRSPSREFKELTKRDAQILLNKELEKLQKTAQLPKAQAELVDKEFDGFRDLFGKFLTAEHQSVKWDKIEKLPSDAVIQSFHFLLIKSLNGSMYRGTN